MEQELDNDGNKTAVFTLKESDLKTIVEYVNLQSTPNIDESSESEIEDDDQRDAKRAKKLAHMDSATDFGPAYKTSKIDRASRSR